MHGKSTGYGNVVVATKALTPLSALLYANGYVATAKRKLGRCGRKLHQMPASGKEAVKV
jgi:hypothetical protein